MTDAALRALLCDIDDQAVWYEQCRGVVNTRTGADVLAEATRLRHADPPLADVDFAAERLGAYPYVLTDAGRARLAQLDPDRPDDAVR